MTSVLTRIPEGSPISPIILLLCVKPVFDKPERLYPNVKYPSYIDDVGLVVVGKYEQINCRALEEMATMGFKWRAANAILFDDPKLVLMYYHCS